MNDVIITLSLKDYTALMRRMGQLEGAVLGLTCQVEDRGVKSRMNELLEEKVETPIRGIVEDGVFHPVDSTQPTKQQKHHETHTIPNRRKPRPCRSR